MTKDAYKIERAAIDEGIEKCWQIRRTHRQESYSMVSSLSERSKAIAYLRGQNCADLILAVHLLYEAKFEEAFYYLFQLVDQITADFDPIWYVRMMNSIGFGYINSGKTDKAVEYLNIGLRVSRELSIDEMRVFILCNLAEIQLDLSIGRFEEAYALLLEADEIGSKSQHSILPLVGAYMAYCSERVNKWENAKQHAEKALELAAEGKDINTVDQCYHFLGEMYYNHGDYLDAIGVTQMSIELQLTYSENYGLTNNYFLLAKCYFELNDEEKTKEFSKIALKNAEKLGMEAIVGGVSELLARMYEKEENYKASLFQMKRVLAQYNKKFTQNLSNHISIVSAELKNIALQKDTEIYRLRNVELKEKSDVLERTIVELKEAQQQLIYQEKMAALGGLIAGIAHEINTPFAVIQAAVQNVNKYVGQSISIDFPELLLKLDEKTRGAFINLVVLASKPYDLLSTAEERTIRLRLTKELEGKSYEKAHKSADWLLDIHIFDLNEDIFTLMDSPFKEEMMKVCYELSGIVRNINNIERAVAKGSKTVFALKNYIHFESSKAFSMSDPINEIKTIVQLYEHQIKNKVELIWDIESSCEVECLPDELNQVWMNLIQNALQAMLFSGTLTISSCCENQSLLICIEDTGGGIPPEHEDKIFDPFFTTKSQGVGSGLGLHLVKRIVEKHHGKISFISRNGKTQFFVTLPAQQSKLHLAAGNESLDDVD